MRKRQRNESIILNMLQMFVAMPRTFYFNRGPSHVPSELHTRQRFVTASGRPPGRAFVARALRAPRIKPYLSLHAEAEAPDDLAVEEDEEARGGSVQYAFFPIQRTRLAMVGN